MTSQSRAWEWGEKRDFKKYSTSVQFQFVGMQSRVLLSHVHLISSRVWKRWMLRLFTRLGSHRGQPSNLQSWQPIYGMAVCQNFSWLAGKRAANKYRRDLLWLLCFEGWRTSHQIKEELRSRGTKIVRCFCSGSYPLEPFHWELKGLRMKQLKDDKGKKAKEDKDHKASLCHQSHVIRR